MPGMLILAVDQSTTTGSLAVLDDGHPVAEHTWEENGRDNRQFFSTLNRVFADHSIEPATIDIFAVGIGPGAFAGLRISLSAMRAMALPGGKPVVGISSGEAIASDIRGQGIAREIVVVGDARRGHFWHTRIKRGPASYGLATLAELPGVIGSGCALASPDWDRIGPTLESLPLESVVMFKKRSIPQARVIGVLAASRLASGTATAVARTPTDVLSPIYMHPPVSVQPKFV